MGTLFITSCGGNETENLPEEEKTSQKDPQLEILDEQIRQNPNDPELWFNKSEIYYGKQDFKNAIKNLEKAIESDSSIAFLYIRISDIYLMEEDSRSRLPDSKKAVDWLLLYLNKYPENDQVMHELAETYTYIEHYNESIQVLNQAIALKKFNPEAYFKIGFNYKYKKDTLKAISNFQKAVEQDPDNYDAYMQLGTLFASRKSDLALTYFNNALAIDPTNTNAIYAKAKFLQDKLRFREAKATYKSLILLDRQHEFTYYNLGYIYFAQDSLEKSYSNFERAIKASPAYADAYYGRGTVSEAMGNIEYAKRDYKNALNINPKHSLALEALQELE